MARFDAFVLAGHPAVVRDAIARWRAALDEDAIATLLDEQQLDEAVYAAAATYLGVATSEDMHPADQVALTSSTTAGLGLVYGGLQLAAGDHVLTTEHDFYSTHEALRLAAGRASAEVERVRVHDDPASASTDEIVSRLLARIRPTTRLLAITWVHSSTGVKMPVRAIADALSSAGLREQVVLGVDAIHGLGAEDAGPLDLGCDLFISGTHKWLFGPRGTGLVWARPGVADRIAPTIPAFYAPTVGNWLFGNNDPSPFGLAHTPGGYTAFEHRWALSDAFRMHLDIGRSRVAARTSELATQLKDGLRNIDGVRLATPRSPELSSGIVCCDLDGFPLDAAVRRLRDDYGVAASLTPYREQLLRFGTSIVVSPDEVDRAVAAVAAIQRR